MDSSPLIMTITNDCFNYDTINNNTNNYFEKLVEVYFQTRFYHIVTRPTLPKGRDNVINLCEC